jgi:DNA-3-methyladenine glycosylase II
MGGGAVTERVIIGDSCVAEGVEWLCANDPMMAHAYAQTGLLPLRLQPEGFAQLFSAIISQQVSVASANAIWKRLQEAAMTEPHQVAATSEDALRDLGLSRQKARYASALAKADIDYGALRDASTEQVINTLTAVTGIGAWTAEIYAMFSLGRADVFASGDLALQEAARILYQLPERPRDKALRVMAEKWQPWRAVAARQLWAYYRIAKDRDGIR